MQQLQGQVQRGKEPGRWAWYLLFFAMPFYEAFFLHIRPIEVAVLISMLFILARGASGFVGIRALDIFVMMYALFQILVVAISSGEFYESARYYRYLVLGPALTYMVIRMLPFSPRVLLRASLIMVLVVSIQSVFQSWIYVTAGQRAHGAAHVFVTTVNTYAFYTAYCFALLWYARRHLHSLFKWPILLMGMTLLGVGLVVSASRATTFPFLLMLPIVMFIWRSKFRRSVLAFSLIFGLLGIVFSLAMAPPSIEYDESQLLESRNEANRVLSVNDYLSDGMSRILFWAYLFDKALESPVLGSGYANYDISDSGIGGHAAAAAHNILISNVVTGGVLSLTLILVIMFAGAMLMVRFKGELNLLDFQAKALLACYPILLLSAITGDLIGGRAVLFFFLLGIMQQIVVHADHVDNELEVADDLSDQKSGGG